MTFRIPAGSRVLGAVVLSVTVALAAAACGGSDHTDKAASKTRAKVGNTDTVRTRFFAANSPWNTRIDSAQVDPRSNVMMELAHERIGVLERPGNLPPVIQRRIVNAGLYINTERWTTPVVTGGVTTKLSCRQINCGDKIPDDELPVPADSSPDPRYDGWFTIIDSDGRYAYDLWRARREDNDTISYQFAKRWDLDGEGFSPPQTVGARGSGLPLFAGLIRHDELAAGRIDHALAISVPGPAQRQFVQPASTTDGNGVTGSLPEGARIRLKDNVTLRIARDPETGAIVPMTAAQRRTADAIVAALRIYGAIVVDRAAVPTLYAQRDVTADELVGNELQGLTLNDFEVLTLPRVQIFPATSSGASTNPSATATTGIAQ